MKLKLPYSFRGNQEETIASIKSAIENRNQIILESPTGSGKTFTSLAATLPFVIKEGLKIVYCVRTNSQQKQVIHELQQFKKAGNSIKAVAIQGRNSLCPQQENDSELKKSNWSEKSKICKSLKLQARAGEAGCQYYRPLLHDGHLVARDWSSDILTADEFARQATEAGVCPYELNKLMLKEAQVVIAPYVYFFEEFARQNLISWMGTSIENIVTIVDEAHNLPDWARSSLSESMTIESVDRAISEVKEENYYFPDGSSIISFLKSVKKTLNKLSEEHVKEGEEEAHLPSYIISADDEVATFETEMMSYQKSTLYKIQKDCFEVAGIGNSHRMKLLKKGKRPRSYLGSVGDFLCSWLDSVEEHTIRLISIKPIRLEKVGLDPRVVTSFLNSTSGVVMMSGTLSPLRMFRDTIGLRSDSLLEKKPSTFPRDNRKIVYLDDINTSRSNENRHKNWYEILHIFETMVKHSSEINDLRLNIAVFFPSYRKLDWFLENITLPKHLLVIRERAGMVQEELMQLIEDFKSEPVKDGGKFAIMAGVMGGRFAEGIDFPGQALSIIVIAGIPYPVPGVRQEALQHYYDKKFNNRGWEFTVRAPAIRKILQAAGRAIRSKTDKGFIVIADLKAGGFQDYIPDLEPSDNLIAEISEFFEA